MLTLSCVAIVTGTGTANTEDVHSSPLTQGKSRLSTGMTTGQVVGLVLSVTVMALVALIVAVAVAYKVGHQSHNHQLSLCAEVYYDLGS